MNGVESFWAVLYAIRRTRNPLSKLLRIRRVIGIELPAACTRFESQLSGDYVLGETISAADISIFSLVRVVLEKAARYGAGKVIDRHPRLRAHQDRIAALPRVEAYFADD